MIYYFSTSNQSYFKGMKNMRIIILLFVAVTILPLNGKSQKFEYQVLYEGIGDNREFFSGKANSQTILGSRGAFEVGILTGQHRMRAGLSQLLEFGSDIDFHKPKLTLYYQYSDDRKEFMFGAFPRRGLIDFPLAMLTDTLLYYRPNIEGMFGEVRWDWGHQNGFVDWVSRQTDINRENFMAGFSGQIYHKSLFFENYLLLFHDAGAAVSIPGDNIKDYLGFALQGGIRTVADPVRSGYVKAGVLGSSFRERSVTDGFINNISLFAEANGRWHNYGLKSVLHSGAGHRFAYGDLFYRLDNYWRTDVIWYFINHKNVRGRFNLSFHVIDWNDLDQQQQLTIVYLFGN